jgi:hypothetical protein
VHADDTNYTIVKNGVVVVSGTGPAIRVDGNRLVIRDGPQETPPLCLTRAEASRRLRHVIVCGHAGGFVTFDALRWLRDTGVAFSQLDWNGTVIIASGPRGPDQPDLRRAQALVCSGVMPGAADAITCEILKVKLCGQAEVARLLGFEEASATISDLAEGIAGVTDGARALSLEAEAAWSYWNLWERMPLRFARRNLQRLGADNRWHPGRPDPWLTFGSRRSHVISMHPNAGTPWPTTSVVAVSVALSAAVSPVNPTPASAPAPLAACVNFFLWWRSEASLPALPPVSFPLAG